MGDPASKGPGFQPLSAIRPTRPLPSLLTAARDRTRDAEWPEYVRTVQPEYAERGGLPNATAATDPVVEGRRRWMGGIASRAATCVPGYRWAYGTPADPDTVKETPADIEDPGFYPYLIYVPYRCDWVLRGDHLTASGDTIREADYAQDAEDQLDAVTPFHVANELWTGSVESLNPSFITAGTDITVAAAVHPIEALEVLLDFYTGQSATTSPGQGGSRPIIHAPYSIVCSLIANHVVQQQGDVYYGPGCVVSPGPGYPVDGTDAVGPAGATAGAGNQWMWVTGPVEYALGEITTLPDEAERFWDRRANAYQITAERLAIHRFDPLCVAACKAFMPTPPITVP